MNKRILGVVLVLGALGSTNAFASRARDLVLGTGDAGVVLGQGGSSGTFYTDDAYNIFYNPAYVNDYKNWAIIEKSNFTSNGVTTASGSTAEGGFVTDLRALNLAVFFNRQDDLQDAIYGGQVKMRPLDVLFGGTKNSFKWGLGLSFASYTAPDPNHSVNTVTSIDWVIRAGMSYKDFEPFLNWRASGVDGGTVTGPANNGLEAGIRHRCGEWTSYGVYKYEQFNSQTTTRDFGFGIGRTTKASDAVKLMYSAAVFRQTVGANNGSLGAWNGSSTPGTRFVIPFNLAFEWDALLWLTLRSGLGYNFLDHVNTGSVADNTTARIGATAHAGKVDFEFAVGDGSSVGNESPNDTTAQSFDLAHNFFTAADLQYHW